MNKINLETGYTAIGVSADLYAEIMEEKEVLYDLLSDEGYTMNNLIQCATIFQWTDTIRWTDAKLGKEISVMDILKSDVGMFNLTYYHNYNLFKGANKCVDQGDVNKLFGNSPQEPITSKLMPPSDYKRRTKRSYSNPVHSLMSLFELLYSPRYLLILRDDD